MSIGMYDKTLVIEVDFQQATIAGTDTKCNYLRHIFTNFRDVETVESVEKWVKKLLGCKTIRDLMITFHTEGDYYSSREGYCRIIREWDDKFRIIKWQAENIRDDYTLEKVSERCTWQRLRNSLTGFRIPFPLLMPYDVTF